MYVVLSFGQDSEYCCSNFEFSGIYNNLNDAISVLKNDQFCVFMEGGKTINDYIGEPKSLVGLEDNEYYYNDYNSTVRNCKIKEMNCLYPGHDYKMYPFKAYYNSKGKIFVGTQILLSGYQQEYFVCKNFCIIMDEELNIE